MIEIMASSVVKKMASVVKEIGVRIVLAHDHFFPHAVLFARVPFLSQFGTVFVFCGLLFVASPSCLHFVFALELVLAAFSVLDYVRAPSVNYGHRASGGDQAAPPGLMAHMHIPENSCAALRACCKGDYSQFAWGDIHIHPVVNDPRTVYIEFDVQETADGHLVVFHDDYLAERMLPPNFQDNAEAYRQILQERRNTGANKGSHSVDDDDDDSSETEERQQQKNKELLMYVPPESSLRVRDLTLEQLKRLRLRPTAKAVTNGTTGKTMLNGVECIVTERVPTLREMLTCALECNLQKPIMVEVKSIQSDVARQAFLDELMQYKHSMGAKKAAKLEYVPGYDLPRAAIGVIAFSSNFADSFGKPGAGERLRWERLFRANKIAVRSCWFHSLDLLTEA